VVASTSYLDDFLVSEVRYVLGQDFSLALSAETQLARVILAPSIELTRAECYSDGMVVAAGNECTLDAHHFPWSVD
jgi:hypothetical protein